jgi:formylglycine-generating enzyme
MKIFNAGLFFVSLVVLFSATTHADVFNMPLGQTSLEMVPVGNPGNTGEWSGETHNGFGPDRICGAVGYNYNIGKYEVTAGQYTEFLNAKAKSDPHFLYHPNMDTANYSYGCNIKQSGSEGNYIYSVASDWANRPVNEVTYWDALRFTNWLYNGQGDGDTESGAYTLNGYSGGDGRTIIRNPEAKWFLPSEDEWYKAAYYDPNKPGGAGYYKYATKGDTVPSNVGCDGYTDPGNHANYYDYENSSIIGSIGAPYFRTNVGEFENSASAYGTFDQAGNVREWTEASLAGFGSDSCRSLRGGSYAGGDNQLTAAYRDCYFPFVNESTFGFRVASVPEPSAIILLGIGAISILACAWRRRAA